MGPLAARSVVAEKSFQLSRFRGLKKGAGRGTLRSRTVLRRGAPAADGNKAKRENGSMASQPTDPRQPTERAERSTGKKRYEPPRVLFREPMEVVAGFCGPPQGKADAVQCAILST